MDTTELSLVESCSSGPVLRLERIGIREKKILIISGEI